MANKKTLPPTPSAAVRLIRYIASSGISSRRDAEAIIRQGDVAINGATNTNPWHFVQPGDTVTYKRRVLVPEKKVYYLLNKPKNTLCTTDDPEGRTTVLDLIGNAEIKRNKLYTIGRLDYDSTGLVIITNDGDLTQKLAHPRNAITKKYIVTIDGKLTNEQLAQTRKGIKLNDGMVAFDSIYYLNATKKNTYAYEVILHSGKNRVIRRVFRNLGFFVQTLDRKAIAFLTKHKLPLAHWRPLTAFEVKKLYDNKQTVTKNVSDKK